MEKAKHVFQPGLARHRHAAVPRRSGPKRASQGCGRGSKELRNLLGTWNQLWALPLGSSGWP